MWDFTCWVAIKGADIWDSNSQVKEGSLFWCSARKGIFHQEVSERGFTYSSYIKSSNTKPYLLQRTSLLSDNHSHSITTSSLVKSFSQLKLPGWTGADPEADWMSFLSDSLKLLPSPSSFTHHTARKTMESFSIWVKLLYPFKHFMNEII